MSSFHENIARKIADRSAVAEHIAQLRSQAATEGRCLKVVFTNGCFDLVHRGHVDYLSRSRDLGDLLVVGLNSDCSVRRLKGESRPIVDEQSRAMLLAAFECVDFVTIFDEDTPFDLIRLIQPDVLVKGGDYRPENIVGADVVRARGGEVVVLQFVDGFSTSSVVSKIRDNG